MIASVLTFAGVAKLQNAAVNSAFTLSISISFSRCLTCCTRVARPHAWGQGLGGDVIRRFLLLRIRGRGRGRVRVSEYGHHSRNATQRNRQRYTWSTEKNWRQRGIESQTRTREVRICRGRKGRKDQHTSDMLRKASHAAISIPSRAPSPNQNGFGYAGHETQCGRSRDGRADEDMAAAESISIQIHTL